MKNRGLIETLGKVVLFLWVALFFFNKSLAQTTNKIQSEPSEIEWSKITERLSSVIVRIECGNDSAKTNGSGTVVGITKSGSALILTASHVITSNYESESRSPDFVPVFYENILVKLENNSSFQVETREDFLESYVDPANDLALIKTKTWVGEKNVISYTPGNKVSDGQPISALGFPGDETRLNPILSITQDQHRNYLIFEDEKNQIMGGSSGGPIINSSGEMIGITTRKYQGRGIAYALNMSAVSPIVNNWLEDFEPLQIKWRNSEALTFWQRFYKDPLFVGVEAAVIGASFFLILQNKETTAKDLPGPPSLP
jgi:S1-C subfamily serine protease